ncbi:MAG TPA: NUDIX domain-containing protein [Thermomicrobiales bacterium]|nr:NUDIX domain-containing protein [Thermomicrobiales bacterium]
MPDIVSDIVDVYVFRRLSARVQFLLLHRRNDVPLGNTWQSFHTQIGLTESTIAAGRRAVRELAGLNVSEVYSADYVNEFYDDLRDVVVLAPVLAVNVSPQAPVNLGPEFRDCAWWDTNQAAARLPFAGQRWAVRHIDDIMSVGHEESQLYRLQIPATAPAPRGDSLVESGTDPDVTDQDGPEGRPDWDSDEVEGDPIHPIPERRTDVP